MLNIPVLFSSISKTKISQFYQLCENNSKRIKTILDILKILLVN